MTTRKRTAGAAAATGAFVIASLVTPTGTAVAAPRPEFPTWDEVQNARKSQAAAAAEVDRIEGILVALEATSAELGKQAQIKGEQYAIAQDALDATTRKVTALKEQVTSAQERADESTARAARLIAQLARTGGGDMSMGLMFGSAEDADQLLARLSTADKLSESSAAILERAVFDRNLADSLADDASAAEKVRKKAAATAQAAFDVAQAASDQAAAQVADQASAADQMYSQLAVLKNSTAATERAFYEGQAAAAPAAPAAPSNPSAPVTPGSPATPTAPTTPATPGSPPPTTPSTPPAPTTPPPTPSPGAVGQAIAFAKTQLGDMYLFGGEGPDHWDCSGLTKFSYASAGVYIGTHSTTNQYNTMKAQNRLVSIGALQAGDLLYYSTGGSTTAEKYHTALYIGGGQMIEAPRPGVAVRIVSVRYGDLVPYAGRPTG